MVNDRKNFYRADAAVSELSTLCRIEREGSLPNCICEDEFLMPGEYLFNGMSK